VTEPTHHDERRTFNRVQAQVTVRPVSLLAHAVPRRVNDVSLGGLRCFSDDERRKGERLELELCFPDGRTAILLAEVVWAERLPPGAPARFDVGMHYVDCSPYGLALIRQAVQAMQAGVE
jgi:hypothetical protein